VKFAGDYNRLSQIPGYLAIRKFTTPPQLSDLGGFGFCGDDVKGLKNCKPQNRVVQVLATTMESLRKAANWSAPDVDNQVSQFVQEHALARLLEYQEKGNHIFCAVYNDKREQVNGAD